MAYSRIEQSRNPLDSSSAEPIHELIPYKNLILKRNIMFFVVLLATSILGLFLYRHLLFLEPTAVSERPLRIAQVSIPVESVPPKGYAGIERIVYYLVEQLVERGHKVTLFAPPGSNTSAELVTNLNWTQIDPKTRFAKRWDLMRWQIEQLKQRINEFDIIHFHYTEDLCYTNLDAKDHNKIVATLHWIVNEGNVQAWSDRHLQLVSISNDQMSYLGNKSIMANVVNIYHGLPQSLYPFTAKPSDGKAQYLAFIGRITPEKGPHTAIQIAVRAGIPLKIAARLDGWVNEDYWKNEIKLLLDKHHDMVEIVGEINDTQKSQFFGNALALLFPITSKESFGLVMIEAMACGTPVIARRKSSVTEVVDQNITGLVFDTDEQAIEAVKQVHTIDRAGVRRRFEQRFTAKIMADGYVKLFEQMVDRNANDKQTTTGTSV